MVTTLNFMYNVEVYYTVLYSRIRHPGMVSIHPELHVQRGGEREPGGPPELPRRRRGTQDQRIIPG